MEVGFGGQRVQKAIKCRESVQAVLLEYFIDTIVVVFFLSMILINQTVQIKQSR